MRALREGLAMLAIPACVLAQAARTIRYPAVVPGAIVSLADPSLTIPSGDCEFNRLNGLVMQAGAGIVLSNFGEHQLCFYDARGALVKKAGREGAGPGEFVTLEDASLYRGDSILVSDRLQKRVSIFGPAGQVGRQFIVSVPDAAGSHHLTRALPNGDILMTFAEVKVMAPRPDAVVFYEQLYRAEPSGTITGRVARLVEGEHFVQGGFPQFGGQAYWSLQWGRAASLSTLPNGFVTGDGGDSWITEYDADGRPTVVHVVPLERQPITPGMIERYKSAQLAAAKPEQRAVVQRMVDEMPYPKETPAYKAIIADEAGAIWVQSYPDSTGSYWLRLDPSTATARGYRFPPKFKLMAVRSNRACGIGHDDDDLETVYCFSIPR